MTEQREATVLEPFPATARKAKLRVHMWRSFGVGCFTTWAVALDRMLDGLGVGWTRVLVVFLAAMSAWFLIGSGSGLLWSYLPQAKR